MTALWNRTITLYNDIPATTLVARHFDRHVIPYCQIQGTLTNKADGTVNNPTFKHNVIIKQGVDAYCSPFDYSHLPVDERDEHFTLRVGDFVVFDEVEDDVSSAQDFVTMKTKYRDNGMIVQSFAIYLNKMNVDNIMISEA